MKQSLPSHPSVEHLKKQAKNLLKSCRQGEPNSHRILSEHHPRYASGIKEPEKVALQEVQLVIARQYGYTSWPDLTASLQTNRTAAAAPDPAGILLYTNGGSAVDLLNAAKFPGHKLEWLEALHDGPVPRTGTYEELYRIRAEHFARLGWTSIEGALEGFKKRDKPLSHPDEYTQLQLWFEHDLFDQLQLIQVLDHLAEFPEWRKKTVIYQFETYLGRLNSDQVEKHQPAPVAVTESPIRLAQAAWNAFRDPSPAALLEVIRGETAALPFLKSALLRLCQEFPSRENGLGRTEAQILSAVAQGKRSPQEIFRHSQDQEEAVFMGDSSFYGLLQRLTLGKNPLLDTASGEPFRTPIKMGYTDAFRNQSIQITKTGEKTLNGEFDWLTALPAPYWIGGVRIAGPDAPRWDPGANEFRA